MYDEERGPVLRVDYMFAREAAGDLSTELRIDGRPARITKRALDDAAFAAKELRDIRPMTALMDFRRTRAQLIEMHFSQAATRLIRDLEEAEGWNKWLDEIAEGASAP